MLLVVLIDIILMLAELIVIVLMVATGSLGIRASKNPSAYSASFYSRAQFINWIIWIILGAFATLEAYLATTIYNSAYLGNIVLVISIIIYFAGLIILKKYSRTAKDYYNEFQSPYQGFSQNQAYLPPIYAGNGIPQLGNPIGENPQSGNPMSGNQIGGNPIGGNPMSGNPVSGNPMGENLIGGNPRGNPQPENPVGENPQSVNPINVNPQSINPGGNPQPGHPASGNSQLVYPIGGYSGQPYAGNPGQAYYSRPIIGHSIESQPPFATNPYVIQNPGK